LKGEGEGEYVYKRGNTRIELKGEGEYVYKRGNTRIELKGEGEYVYKRGNTRIELKFTFLRSFENIKKRQFFYFQKIIAHTICAVKKLRLV